MLESLESEDAESVMDAGRAVSERLRQAGLDARSIGLKGELHRRPYKAAVVDGLTLALGLLMLPFILISYGPQIIYRGAFSAIARMKGSMPGRRSSSSLGCSDRSSIGRLHGWSTGGSS